MVLTLVIVTDEGSAYDALKAAQRGVARAPLAHPRRHQAARPLPPGPGAGPAGRRGAWSAPTRAPARPWCCGCTASWPTTPSRWSCRCCCRTPPWCVWWPDERAGRPGARTRWARSPSAGSPTRPRPRTRSASSPSAPPPTPPATPTWPGPGSPRGARCWRRPWTRTHCHGHRGVGGGRGVQPEHRTARAVARRPAGRPGRAQGLRRARDHRGPAGHRRTATSAWTAPDGRLADAVHARASRTGTVALKRRETSELIAEELRRLDPDDIYARTVQFGVEAPGQQPREAGRPGSGRRRAARARPAPRRRRPRRRRRRRRSERARSSSSTATRS